MLKIKDNVDLKELEKFGFKHRPAQRNQYEIYAYENANHSFYPCLYVWVYCEDRIIGVNGNQYLDILFDLIQAGFVEKLEECDE